MNTLASNSEYFERDVEYSEMEEREQQIIALYLGGESASSLARKFGRSEALIRKIISKHKVTRPKKVTVAEAKPKGGPVSSTHESLGLRLGNYRVQRACHDKSTAAEKLGWSSHKLSKVEAGTFSDLTLFDVMDIAEYIGVELNELF